MRHYFQFLTTILALWLMIISNTIFAQGQAANVELSPVKAIDKVEEILAVGTLFPINEVTIKPEISGKINGINFEEGKSVDKDAVLITFDNRTQKANLKDAEARYTLTKQNDGRFKAAKTGVTAQMRDETKALVLQALASVEVAQVELDKMTLKAPFAGIVGLKNVELGDYVQAGTNIVTLSNIKKLKLEFNIPERVAHVARIGQHIEFLIDNFPKETFEAEVYAISPGIEMEGRSLAIRAQYDNSDEKLIPGMFSRLALKIPLGYKVITVPEEAIFALEGQHYVYRAVKNAEGNYKAVLTQVELGHRTSFSVEIIEGLAIGDLVVTVGQLRIRDGMVIKAMNVIVEDIDEKIKETIDGKDNSSSTEVE